MRRSREHHIALNRIEREKNMDRIASSDLDGLVVARLVTVQVGRPWLTELGEKTLDEWDAHYGVQGV